MRYKQDAVDCSSPRSSSGERIETRLLMVQLRRLLVLAAARRPILACQCLAAGGRERGGHWELEPGCRPLLAETFSDPANQARTINKRPTGPGPE